MANLRRDEAARELENTVRQQYRVLTQLAENLALNEIHIATVRENFSKVQQQRQVGLVKEVDYLAASRIASGGIPDVVSRHQLPH